MKNNILKFKNLRPKKHEILIKKGQKYAIFLLIFGLIFMFGCHSKLNQTVQEKLSEVRFNLFSGGNDEIAVRFTSGFREDPYVLNGVSQNKKEFGIITVKFLKEISSKTAMPNFVITIESMDYDGEFELNPFDQTFVQDIETFVLDNTTVSIKICYADFVFEGDLKNVSKDFSINHKDALNVFVKEYKKDIQALLKNKTDFEVYVKILNDPSLNLDKNYFYVCLISNSGNSFSAIIDPYSGIILAKNQNKNQQIL